ncbi:PAS domain-containing protein [Sorangium sp. So ce1024]|uniref:sensor histidine kinase n=1 Tax=Sorangium sp. So ce1024 TaxID=3133327 RepID=UPI003F05F32A
MRRRRSAAPAAGDALARAAADASLVLASAGDDAGALREAIAAAAARALRAEIACLYEILRGPRALALVASWGERGAPGSALQRLPLDAEGLAAATARSGVVQVAPGGERAAELLDVAHLHAQHGSSHALAIPIAFAGELRAVLLCASAQPILPQAEAVEIAGALAGLFGMALAAAAARALGAQVAELEREKSELERSREQLQAALTEARRTEEALRLRGEGFARAQKLARLANWDWRIEGNELVWSEESYRMLGLPVDTGPITYEGFLERVHPDDRGRLQRAVDLALQQAEPYCVDYRIIRPDGEERAIHTVADIVRAEDGTPLRMIGTALDVTEQRRVEDALRLSEARLRIITEHASDVIFRIRLGPDVGYEYVNPAVVEHTGYPPEAWYENPRLFPSLLHPEDTGRYHDFVERMAEAGGRITFRIIDRSGRMRWIATHVTIERDEGGKPLTAIGISRDVTVEKLADEERERLLEQLAAERTWLNTVIERTPVGIVLLDPTGQQITWNHRAQELARATSPGELGGAACLRLPDGQPLPSSECPAMRALRGEVTTARELSLGRADGGTLAVLMSAGPIVDGNGKLLGAVLAFEDITRLKELERRKDEWTSVVAHDLKQPVTTIVGYAAQLERRPHVADAVKSRAGHILASARRLGRMVSDLTDISRIESRRLAIERGPVDLPALVQAVVERTEGDTAGHPVEIEIRGEIPVVSADAGRVEQVLSNLLSNAAKYGDPGTPIKVRLERRGGAVETSIWNRGRSIPPEERPLLFERFFRGKAKEERVVGLGLGLYIARGLIEAHGGTIWVECPGDRDTVFHFTLPVMAERA